MFFFAVWYSIVEMHQDLFISSVADGHLGSFPSFAIVDGASINILQ